MRPISTALAAAAVLATQRVLSASPAAAALPDFPAPTHASADLSRYRTFAFFEPANDASLPHAPPLTREMVQAARAALEQRGYVYDEAQPELRVNLFAMLVERQKLRVTPTRPAFAGRPRVDAVPFHQGTFVVDLVDTRHHVLVWRGTAHGRITQQGLNDPAGAIQVAVRGIFSRFPATAQ
ncbi:MAG: putative lipoprotein [Panacagrimonas sp.]|nr:DUF4136 domain-containing protein [Panacagrimonas sp.]MCC2658925.1 putative lipoprotein [Panacagrimonas sp.]